MRKIVLLMIMLMCIMLLVGCGAATRTKLSATKLINNSDGEVECSIQVTLSNDVVSSVKEERKFPNDKSTEEYYQLLLLLNENNSGTTVEKSGRKITETVSQVSSSYKYSGMSTEKLKTALESDGWTIDETK